MSRLPALVNAPRVFVKVSGLNKFDVPPYDKISEQLREILGVFGKKRVLWGSELPVLEYEPGHTLRASLDFVRERAGLSVEEKD